jgi:hypothetical protein
VSDFESIASCLLYNDGSLPGIELKFGDPREIPTAYKFLISSSTQTNPVASFWDTTRQCDVLVDSVPDAATLVIEGRADPFHYCLGGIRVAGFELPDLGIFVFPDGIELDWRMGPEWTEANILAFFELLHLLSEIAPSIEFADAGVEGLPEPEKFFSFREAYERERKP